MAHSDAEQALVAALLAGDAPRSAALLQAHPALERDSVAVGLCLARPDAAAALTEETVNRNVPPHGWPPLLYLCSSRPGADAVPSAQTARRQTAVAEALVALGADVNAGVREAQTIRGYRTALGAAIGCARNPALAELLIGAGADVADGPTLYEGCAMWYAVRERDGRSLRALLAAEPPQWHVCHALPHALRYNDAQLTRLLLEHGGDPNWSMGIWSAGGNCLHEATMLDSDPQVVEALLAHGAKVAFNDRDGRAPLAIAVCLNRHALATVLRRHGAKEQEVGPVARWIGACMAGDANAAAKLLAEFADVAAVDALASAREPSQRRAIRRRLASHFKQTDHLWACRAVGRLAGDAPPALRQLNPQALPLLLAGGIDPDARDDDGECALHLAAAGNAEAATVLLDAGANPALLNFRGERPLDVARRHGQTSIASELARRSLKSPSPPRDPALPDAFERAADAIADGDLDTLQALLLEHPALATARSQRPHHCTLLNYVGANGFEHWRQRTPANAVAIIECLVAAGSDPNAVCYTYRGGPDENTLGLLTSSDHPKRAGLKLAMVAALARGGATLDGAYALLAELHAARERGELAETAARLDVAARDAALALVEAAALDATEILLALLDAGVDVRARRDDGATALHQAAFDGNAWLVEMLLERGADPRLRDDVFDGTAAGWAHAGGHEELGQALQRRLRELEASGIAPRS